LLTSLIRKFEETEGIRLKSISMPSGGLSNQFVIAIDKTEDIPKWDYFTKCALESVKGLNIKRKKNEIAFTIDVKDLEALSQFETEYDKKKFLINEPSAEYLTIIAKVTNTCNLDCEYCYDRPFREKLGHNGIIKMEKLIHLLDMATKYSKRLTVIFHGGEPTLAGLDFYKQFINEVLPRYPYCEISLNIQTNGTLLNKSWFEMFDGYNKTHEGAFQIGTSFNALAEQLRFKSKNPEDSLSKKVIGNMILAKEYGYNLGIGAIDVVTKPAHPHMIEMYEFYKSKGLAASFNLVNESGSAIGKDLIFRTKEEQKQYLLDTEKYFTYWLNDPDDEVYLDRYASEFMEILLSKGTVCEYGSDCVGNWIGINSNGDLYPCDRALSNKYRMGNVMEFKSIEEVFNSKGFKTIRAERDLKFNHYCGDCKFFSYCHLNCPMKDIDLYGSADKPNRVECEMLKLSIEAIYRALYQTDIERCNLIARTFLIKNNCILPKEIPRLLKELGIEDQFNNYIFSLDNAKLFNKEFELFRLFNCIPLEESILPKDYEMSVSDREIYLTDNRFNNIKEALQRRAMQIEEMLKSKGEEK